MKVTAYADNCCVALCVRVLLLSQLTLPTSGTAQQAAQQQQQQSVPLYRTMRLLPLSSSGVLVLNAALPEVWGTQLQEANPPGSYWFFDVLLTVSN